MLRRAAERQAQRFANIAGMGVLVRLLGGFGVEVDERAVDVASLPRRSRELVELLALTPGHRLLRDQVIEALFGHLDAEAGSANLHKAASVARSHVGDRDAVVLDGGCVALWPGAAVETDAERFEAAADEALAGGDPETCRCAAAGYAGDL